MKHFPNKASFFAALDELDLDRQDEEDTYTWESLFTPASKRDEMPISHKTACSAERFSSPPLNSDSRPLGDPQTERGSPSKVLGLTTVTRPRVKETMPPSKNGRPQKKRKTNSSKIIPEDQQIFKGLVFCKCSIL